MNSTPQIERTKLTIYKGCDFAQLFYDFGPEDSEPLNGFSFRGVIFNPADGLTLANFQFEVSDDYEQLLFKLAKESHTLLSPGNFEFDVVKINDVSSEVLPGMMGDVEVIDFKSAITTTT